jgi:hypothetical protein
MGRVVHSLYSHESGMLIRPHQLRDVEAGD